MKILHTSDWHLGHRLHEFSQVEEQALFLDWLEQLIVEQEIDVLLIAGDVFDTNTPSTQSLKMYYDFLVKLKSTACQHIVITGGNHDSPGTLNAPKEILNALDIKVVGKATGAIEDEVFLFQKGDEKVIVAATAYLRDQDIRRAVDGEKFEEITERYKTALINHYQETALCCEKLQKLHPNAPIIGMGHLFAVGGSVSDSEQSIYVGNLGHIGADDFPDIFDYIALGHLHRPQIVGGDEKIRYSGSPNILSFSEIGYDKKVIVLETKEARIVSVEDQIIPKFRAIEKIKGTRQECIAKVELLEQTTYGLSTWVEILLKGEKNADKSFPEIYELVKDRPIEILKITSEHERTIEGLEQKIREAKSVKELSPEEVFEQKCIEECHEDEDLTDVKDAYHEILNQIREGKED